MWVTYSTYVTDAFDTWNAVGWLLLGLMLYGVWRLWREMRPDAFQRGLRALREGRGTTVSFSRQRPAPAPANGGGWLQISLLPLMLISCAAAMLLAQAQRPDDVSRTATWAVFVCAGTWYGARAWPHWRGVGPLRNHALAGVISGVAVSALLWGFYLAVDWWWGERSFARVQASVPSLLWWTAMGGAIGAALGAARANLVYGSTRPRRRADEAPTSAGELAIDSTPRRRRVQWGVIGMACCASLLFHLSAAPHLYKQVDIRYWNWNWHWHPHHQYGPSLTLTMAPARAVPAANSFMLDYTDVAAIGDARRASYSYLASQPSGLGSGYNRPAAWVDLPGNMQRAVVAARPISPGQQISRDSLKFAMVPEAVSGVVTDPAAIIGNYATRAIVSGRAIAAEDTAPSARGSSVALPQSIVLSTDIGPEDEPAQDIQSANINSVDILTGLPSLAVADQTDGAMADAGNITARAPVTDTGEWIVELGILRPFTATGFVPAPNGLVQQPTGPSEGLYDGPPMPSTSGSFGGPQPAARPGISGTSPPAQAAGANGPSVDVLGFGELQLGENEPPVDSFIEDPAGSSSVPAGETPPAPNPQVGSGQEPPSSQRIALTILKTKRGESLTGFAVFSPNREEVTIYRMGGKGRTVKAAEVDSILEMQLRSVEVIMRDGRTIRGAAVKSGSRSLQLWVDGQVVTVDLKDVQTLKVGAESSLTFEGAPSPPAVPGQGSSESGGADADVRPEPTETAPAGEGGEGGDEVGIDVEGLDEDGEIEGAGEGVGEGEFGAAMIEPLYHLSFSISR